METLTNQEFIYRQTPASQDGTGTITSIYGNTLKWNQLVANDYIHFQRSTALTWNTFVGFTFSLINGHTYLIRLLGQTVEGGTIGIRDIVEGIVYRPNTGYTMIYTATKNTNNTTVIQGNWTEGTTDAYFNIFDLTMLGIDNLTIDEVKQWFADYYPLPYYQYDSGSLLSFRGEGLKTVGRNLLMPTATFPQTINGVTYTLNADGSITANGTAGSGGSILIYWDKTTYGGKLLADGTYKLSGIIGGSSSTYTIRTNGFGGISISSGEAPFTITDSLPQTNIIIVISSNVTVNNVVFKPMIRRADVTDNTYQKHFSSTLSLPIEEHFPNGMNGVNDVHDELRNDGTTLKMYMVNLGTLNWIAEHENASGQFRTGIVGNIGIPIPRFNTNFICSKYANGGLKNYLTVEDKTIAYTNGTVANPSGNIIRIHDSSCASMTASEFKESLQNVYLCYELETPIETEIPTSLDLTFPIDVGGTEQLLPINEEAPTTAPIICDIDYRGMIPVNATVDPTGSGTIEGLGDYRYHSTATLIAEPTDEIYRFLRWEDENQQTLSTNSEYSFQVGE